MSWDSYIDNLISQGGGNVDKVCIIGLDGGAPWTSAYEGKGIVLQGNEGQVIAQCFKTKEFNSFMANGVHIEGVKYQFLRCLEDDKLVLAKKKDMGAVSMQMSKTAIVICHTKEGGQQGLSNKAVSNIAEYLEGMNM